MKLLLHFGISIALTATPTLSSYASRDITDQAFDVVINQNERISMDLQDSPHAQLPEDVRRIESAYIDNRRGRTSRRPGVRLNLPEDVACFFYSPDAERADRLVSPLFHYISDPGRPRLLQQEPPFMAKYLSCFFSTLSNVVPSEEDVLVLLDSDSLAPPKLARLKKTDDERSSWSETAPGNFRQTSTQDYRITSSFGSNLGTLTSETISKAAVIWPERDEISCFLVKTDEKSPPQRFTIRSPLLTPTEDVTAIHCEEM